MKVLFAECLRKQFQQSAQELCPTVLSHSQRHLLARWSILGWNTQIRLEQSDLVEDAPAHCRGCTGHLKSPLPNPNCSLTLPRLRCLSPLSGWQSSLPRLPLLFQLESPCTTSQEEQSAHWIAGAKACKSFSAVKAAFLQSHGFARVCARQLTYTFSQISHISDFKLDFFCHAPFFDTLLPSPPPPVYADCNVLISFK